MAVLGWVDVIFRLFGRPDPILVPFWLHLGGSGRHLGSILKVFGLIRAPFLVRSWRYVRPFWRKGWHRMGWKKAGRNETNIFKKLLLLFHRTFPHPMWSYPNRSYTLLSMINFRIDTYSSTPTNAKSDRSKQQQSSTLNLSHWQTRDNTSTNWGRRLQRQLLNWCCVRCSCTPSLTSWILAYLQWSRK